jgi:hypothetical protein
LPQQPKLPVGFLRNAATRIALNPRRRAICKLFLPYNSHQQIARRRGGETPATAHHLLGAGASGDGVGAHCHILENFSSLTN